MTPQEIAKSIADELRAHPERWTHSCNARDSAGRSVEPKAPEAICWCLRGHIIKRSPSSRDAVLDAIGDFMHLAGVLIVNWNDAPNRTVADVIDLCDKVAAS